MVTSGQGSSLLINSRHTDIHYHIVAYTANITPLGRRQKLWSTRGNRACSARTLDTGVLATGLPKRTRVEETYIASYLTYKL